MGSPDRMKIFAFLAAALIHPHGVFGVQEFLVEPSDVEVTPGHNTSLACRVDHLQGECRWQRNGKPVGVHSGKYEMRGGSTGECTLTVINVDLKFDDGEWECQVTASSFQALDSLVSKKARLTVRVPPENMSIQYKGSSVSEGGVVTLVEGKLETLVCVTRFSNPAPIISWRFGNKLLPSDSQENFTEPVPNKFRGEGFISLLFSQENQNERLECIVKHPAYLDVDGSTSVLLDILYKPRVEITQASNSVLEEGVGSVSLTCSALGNPTPRVRWTRQGDITPQFVETLEFSPVTRQVAGTYSCTAENSIGTSEEKSTQVVVLYAPKILSVAPSGKVLVMTRNSTALKCTADGNPEPKYQWIQLHKTQGPKVRSMSSELVLESAIYSDEGEYVCEAVNQVGGERRVVRSEEVRVEVEGVPLVSRSIGEVVAVTGRDVRLEAEFCSDPGPLVSAWEWEDVSLKPGGEMQRSGTKYTVEQVQAPHNKDCYISRLLLRGVGLTNSGSYTLNLENKHGVEFAPVKLEVRDPISMASVIGVVIALLVLFVIVSTVLLVAYKKQKLCFKDGDLENLEKEKVNKFSGSSDTKDISSLKESVLPPSTKV